MHICFPYSEDFIEQVKAYQLRFKPRLTIIHSTVPVGTSERLNVVHSPVRGKHPDLEGGVRTFAKFFGGHEAKLAADIFRPHTKVITTKNSRETEALKLWDTTIYGLNIAIEKEIHKYCEEHGLNFDIVYTRANETYNEGYAKLGMPQFTKYVLQHRDEKIGGHCVVQNTKLFNHPILEWIKKYE